MSSGHLRTLQTWAVVTLAASFLLSGCIWPRFFDLQWDEEVRLRDGRVIVVNVRYKYERLNTLSLSRYEGALLRETLLTFDAGPPQGIVVQRFIHQRPMLIDLDERGWYVVLQGRAGSDIQNWGPAQNSNGQRAARLEAGRFVPSSLSSLPASIAGANLLMDYAPIAELAQFDGTRLTLKDKAAYLQQYQLGPIDARIERSADYSQPWIKEGT